MFKSDISKLFNLNTFVNQLAYFTVILRHEIIFYLQTKNSTKGPCLKDFSNIKGVTFHRTLFSTWRIVVTTGVVTATRVF